MSPSDIALIGLGVMGQNLALNMARHGFHVAAYNRTTSVTERFLAERLRGETIEGTSTLGELANRLSRPRKLILMVKAGGAVDAVVGDLRPHLSTGDILIDGGNSHYRDTARREEELAGEGLRFLGAGISGGEEGALLGPSIMPGGPKEAYDAVSGIFEAIAARGPDGSPCVAYLGPKGAGHYVKMVHNGIEYAMMQLLAETYDLLRRGLGIPTAELASLFAEWNKGELASFLVEITAGVLSRSDPEAGLPLVEVILDEAEQKGTGRWTVQDALDLGVAIPTIGAAVEARILSSMKEERAAASKVMPGSARRTRRSEARIEDARNALFCGFVCAYAQGMALLRTASEAYGYGINLAEVARIWRAGCIIRASLLDDIRSAFAVAPTLRNLLVAGPIREQWAAREPGWRKTARLMLEAGLPAPATTASLAYFDAYRSERLPANLIQGLRDYFGAHTYRRVDRPGTFHTDWTESGSGRV
ncbi:MAG: phosphogluconate dehydrogenase (NADP(+)-dependent, decarboxylating) [Chloroflexi bacterium RBG_13_66_10]|nr:MAG: phosphogluconate dehydrogenase (NADP(+)-dependent, decarboxylating) [Chloroflexi bacterium RBG_13_66_10]